MKLDHRIVGAERVAAARRQCESKRCIVVAHAIEIMAVQYEMIESAHAVFLQEANGFSISKLCIGGMAWIKGRASSF
jgi:hypothetical protein